MRLLIAVLLLARPIEAATLRPQITLDAPLVRLSDLFDDVSPATDRTLGPAPQPGSRILIEAPQLAAIARQNGVDWQPASPADRAVLDRPGRALPRDLLLSALRTALGHVGAGDDIEVDLGGFTAPTVSPTGAIKLDIEQLDWDPASGRFTGLLTLSADGTAMQRLRLSGFAQDMIAVPVPVHRLPPGSIIQTQDLRIARVRTGLAHRDVARSPDQAIGQTLRRQAIPGQPLALADLARTPVIQKGARITMRLHAPGLAMAATGQALEAGILGEHIRVRNIGSRAVVEAEIIGPDVVRIIPGSQPLSPASNRTAALSTPIWSTP